ncbi:hypothetical protein Cni_G13043 [Canna indica]|uniref:DNA mismatch repair proteins mutS family domain-containing protein n=1 Tax=Canna indica TaxID=4628 RepID=A0AAQ3KD89_9LILI|nr:hypothetical protein Cni_G13043 [Canna indica]
MLFRRCYVYVQCFIRHSSPASAYDVNGLYLTCFKAVPLVKAECAGLIDCIRNDASILTLLAEVLCLLDMLLNSFAHMISTKPVDCYTRPEFTVNSPPSEPAREDPSAPVVGPGQASGPSSAVVPMACVFGRILSTTSPSKVDTRMASLVSIGKALLPVHPQLRRDVDVHASITPLLGVGLEGKASLCEFNSSSHCLTPPARSPLSKATFGGEALNACPSCPAERSNFAALFPWWSLVLCLAGWAFETTAATSTSSHSMVLKYPARAGLQALTSGSDQVSTGGPGCNLIGSMSTQLAPTLKQLTLNRQIPVISQLDPQSGKSTYLQQVCLIIILAQIGCYIPARFASIRVVDRIFTRIGTGDNVDYNSSTFMTEMKETAFLMQNVSSKSLIVMDELRRATSSSDGFAIAWSCCEHLLSRKAYTIFATHMEGLSEMATIYPNVKILHFEVDLRNNRLDFMFHLRDGPCHVPHYGLLLAGVAGLPNSVVETARTITTKIAEEDLKRMLTNCEKYHSVQVAYQVAQKLICLKYSNQSEEYVRQTLQNLKDSYMKEMLN